MFRPFILSAALAFSSAVYAQTAPSDSDIASYSGLHLAAHKGDPNEINRLIEASSDPNLRDSKGRTPAHVAAFASHDDALTALARGGADMNALEDGIYDVVTIAAVADDPEMVSLAIALGNKANLITSTYFGTALIAAAHLGHYEAVDRLIRGGAPLNHVNNLGWTALMEAVVLGDGGPDHVQTVQILISAGADRFISDRDGVTPLRHARSRGFTEIVHILE